MSVEAGARRIAVGSIASYAGILATFLMPTVKGCNDVDSPAQLAFRDGLPSVLAPFILPVYGGTIVLAIATLIALYRGPGRIGAIASTCALFALWTSAPSFVGFILYDDRTLYSPVAYALPPTMLIAGFLVMGTVRGGWLAYGLRSAAWWVLLLGTPLTMQVAMTLFDAEVPIGARVWAAALVSWPIAAALLAATTGLERLVRRPA